MKKGSRSERGLKLTEMESRFVVAKINGLSNRDAARKAGYSPKSQKTLASTASRLMHKPEIIAAIKEADDITKNMVLIDNAEVLVGIGKIAFADVRGLVDDNGQMRPINELPDSLACAISSVEVGIDKFGQPVFKYKLEGRTKCLELLANIAKITNGQDSDTVKTIADLVKGAALLGAASQRVKNNE